MTKIKGILCEPMELARVVEIEDTLENLQKLVGGYIECLHPFNDDACILCNENGKLERAAPCRVLARGCVLDIICGPMFIVRAPADSEDFASLTDAQLERYGEMFEKPITFRTQF